MSMLTYVKLFNTILDSSVWLEENETRILWITMMAKADRDGIVRGSVPGLAHSARISVEGCRVALGKFLAPDPESTSKEYEGRRIEEVKGGWRLLNHEKYRDLLSLAERREYNRRKQAEYRAKAKANNKGLVMGEIIREHSKYKTQLEKRDELHESSPVYHVPGELPNPSPMPPQSLQDSI